MKVKIFLWQLDRQISNVRCYDLIWSGKNVQCLHFFLFLQEGYANHWNINKQGSLIKISFWPIPKLKNSPERSNGSEESNSSRSNSTSGCGIS